MRPLFALLVALFLGAFFLTAACSLKPPYECGGDAGCWGEPTATTDGGTD